MSVENEVQNRIRASLEKLYGPAMKSAELLENTEGPSSSFIREQLRQRGLSHSNTEIEKSAPKENRSVYRLRKTAEGGEFVFIQVVIVITDDNGNILDVIESG
jgi:hypothetical protein